MGAWGAGPFDNDDALDAVDELVSVEAIAAEFTAAGVEGDVEATKSSRIIAAAECVAAMRGHPHPDLPDELAERVRAFGKPSLELFDRARDNVSAVMSRSELGELWAEEGSGDWNREMTGLVARLNKPQARAGKPKTAKKPFDNPSPCSFCNKPMGEEEMSMFDISLADGMGNSLKQGGWAHIACLNAALHPRHMIQNWQFDDELLDFATKKLRSED